MVTALTAIMFCPLIFLSNRAGTTPGWQKEAKRKSSYKCWFEKWVSGKDKEEWHLYYQFDSRFKAGEERKETAEKEWGRLWLFCHIIFWSNTSRLSQPLKDSKNSLLVCWYEKWGQGKEVGGKDKEEWQWLFLQMPRSFCPAGTPPPHHCRHQLGFTRCV